MMRLGSSLSLLLAVLGAGPASVEVPARVDTPVESRARSSRDWAPCGHTPVLLKDINPGLAGSEPRYLVHGDRVLFFNADDGARGRELWKSSGTGGAGTFLEKDIRPGVGSSDPHSLLVMGERLFFSADDGVHGRELWVSDGTPAGTHLVKDILPGAQGAIPSSDSVTFLPAGGFVYFGIYDPARGAALWRSDGTDAGTTLVKDFFDSPDSFFVSPATEGPDGTIYYSTNIDYLVTLWRLGPGGDAVALDTVGNGSFYGFTWLGDVLVYVRHFDGPEAVLARTEGTPETTYDLADFGRLSGVAESPRDLTRLGGKVYFGAGDLPTGGELERGAELWRTNGTRAGTGMVKDIVPGPESSSPRDLQVLGGRLFFAAEGGQAGRELWVSDGTAKGTRLFKDLEPGAGSSSPRDLLSTQGWLFFSAETAGHGREVWVSDGTVAGTVQLDDIAPGAASSDGPYRGAPYFFTRSGWDVFFAADDGAHGTELWAVPFRPESQCGSIR
ncbi:hypothetical protein P2318_10360 [Myxococcaceae bacterium GXIMD 01537]